MHKARVREHSAVVTSALRVSIDNGGEEFAVGGHGVTAYGYGVTVCGNRITTGG